MIEINLLPASAGKTKRRSGGGQNVDLRAALAGLGGKIRDPYLAAAVAGVIVGAGAVGLLYMTQQKRAEELVVAEEQAVADSTRFANYTKQRVRAQATRDTVLRQINVIRAIDGDRYVWPHVMDEVSSAIPEYTWLTALAVTGTPQGSRTGEIIGDSASASAPAPAPRAAAADTAIVADEIAMSIEGQTVDIEAITRFMRQLEASPFVRDVQLGKSILTLDDGAEVTTFLLQAKFDRPAATSGVVRRVPLTAAGVTLAGN